MPAATKRKQGKTLFVKETLIDNPQATTAVVNKAWADAGMEGTISETLVTKLRSRMGLSGNLRKPGNQESAPATSNHTSSGEARRRTQRQDTLRNEEPRAVEVRGRTESRSVRLAEVEADLDRLLFRVMTLGNLPNVEDAIRETRRALYRAFATKQ